MSGEFPKPVSEATLAAFDAVCAAAEEEAARRCLEEDAPEQSMGPNAAAMIRGGMGFVSRMLRAAMGFASGEILDDQRSWAEVRLPEYGVSHDMIRRNMDRYLRALEERLPPAVFAEIVPYAARISPQGGRPAAPDTPPGTDA